MEPLRIFTFDDEDTPDVSTGYVNVGSVDDFAQRITDDLNESRGSWVLNSLITKSGRRISYSMHGSGDIPHVEFTNTGILFLTFIYPSSEYAGSSTIYYDGLCDIIPKDRLRGIVIRYSDKGYSPHELVFMSRRIRFNRDVLDRFLEIVRFDCGVDDMPTYIDIIGTMSSNDDRWVLNDDNDTYYSQKWGTRSVFPIKFWKGRMQ